MKIGLIGAGRLGQALATRLIAAGHELMVSTSRDADSVRETAQRLGALPGTAAQAATFGEVVVVSVPLCRIDVLPEAEIGDKIVVDTGNYYPNRDGVIAGLEQGGLTTTAMLQARLPRARIVKAFNSIIHPHLEAGPQPTPSGGLHALPLASDDPEAEALGARLVADAGFDPVPTGAVADSWRFERARPGYCRPLDAAALRRALAATTLADFVPEGSWKA